MIRPGPDRPRHSRTAGGGRRFPWSGLDTVQDKFLRRATRRVDDKGRHCWAFAVARRSGRGLRLTPAGGRWRCGGAHCDLGENFPARRESRSTWWPIPDHRRGGAATQGIFEKLCCYSMGSYSLACRQMDAVLVPQGKAAKALRSPLQTSSPSPD
jgi:hypothetical protein